VQTCQFAGTASGVGGCSGGGIVTLGAAGRVLIFADLLMMDVFANCLFGLIADLSLKDCKRPDRTITTPAGSTGRLEASGGA
jgi:hypothetical protein